MLHDLDEIHVHRPLLHVFRDLLLQHRAETLEVAATVLLDLLDLLGGGFGGLAQCLRHVDHLAELDLRSAHLVLELQDALLPLTLGLLLLLLRRSHLLPQESHVLRELPLQARHRFLMLHGGDVNGLIDGRQIHLWQLKVRKVRQNLLKGRGPARVGHRPRELLLQRVQGLVDLCFEVLQQRMVQVPQVLRKGKLANVEEVTCAEASRGSVGPCATFLLQARRRVEGVRTRRVVPALVEPGVVRKDLEGSG
mmetsp:Transcript_136238/g.339743  ORF Transcript_136238/g.339743 Transcript_136238/m.339743 type:complete len:251 (-) Transcript_136238:183-935(-)